MGRKSVSVPNAFSTETSNRARFQMPAARLAPSARPPTARVSTGFRARNSSRMLWFSLMCLLDLGRDQESWAGAEHRFVPGHLGVPPPERLAEPLSDPVRAAPSISYQMGRLASTVPQLLGKGRVEGLGVQLRMRIGIPETRLLDPCEHRQCFGDVMPGITAVIDQSEVRTSHSRHQALHVADAAVAPRGLRKPSR